MSGSTSVASDSVGQDAVPRERTVEDDFPGWHVWGTASGRWWATRKGPGAQWNARDQVPMTVDAEDEAGLRAELAALPLPWD